MPLTATDKERAWNAELAAPDSCVVFAATLLHLCHEAMGAPVGTFRPRDNTRRTRPHTLRAFSSMGSTDRRPLLGDPLRRFAGGHRDKVKECWRVGAMPTEMAFMRVRVDVTVTSPR
jgi:hypothetical protein